MRPNPRFEPLRTAYNPQEPSKMKGDLPVYISEKTFVTPALAHDLLRWTLSKGSSQKGMDRARDAVIGTSMGWIVDVIVKSNVRKRECGKRVCFTRLKASEKVGNGLVYPVVD
ncbi:MAG: hypothetical protein JW730_17485 [Anaerolineales bacterium]|nr:hypothetical protein [Anaerolineales bacterium]